MDDDMTHKQGIQLTSIGDSTFAGKTLKESVQRLANFIDFLPDATFAIDLTGKLIVWNHATEQMTGVNAKDILGKGDLGYAIPFYGSRRPTLVDLVLKQNKEFEENNYFYLKRFERQCLIAETDLLTVNNKDVFLWGKAGPLFDTEGNIIGAIETVRDITERKQMELDLKKRESDLKIKTHELKDLNAALRVLLKQRDDDQALVEEKLLSNIKLLILPYVDKLKKQTDAGARSYINVLESNLRDIVSPFAQKLSTQHLTLTNKEVQIANFIKEGLSTKEIANLLNVSEAAINLHRYRIRQKLSLTKGQNLQSFLSCYD
jgi:PAS domain S-box-containing protein